MAKVFTSEELVTAEGNRYANERPIDHYVAGTPSKMPGANAFYINTVNADSGNATGDWGMYFQLGDSFTSTGVSRKAGGWQVNCFETLHEALLYTNRALGFETVREARLP